MLQLRYPVAFSPSLSPFSVIVKEGWEVSHCDSRADEQAVETYASELGGFIYFLVNEDAADETILIRFYYAGTVIPAGYVFLIGFHGGAFYQQV